MPEVFVEKVPDFAEGERRMPANALPRQRGSSGHVSTTPDRLVDARQEQQ